MPVPDQTHLLWPPRSAMRAATGVGLPPGQAALGESTSLALTLAATLAAASGSGDTANARTQLLGGVLVIVAPYLLGS